MAIFVQDDEPKKKIKEEESSFSEKALKIDSKQEYKDVSSESIRDSDNPEDTLSIKTTIRDKE